MPNTLTPTERAEITRLVKNHPTIDVSQVGDTSIGQYIDSYAARCLEKYGNPYGPRTIEQIAAFIHSEICYDAGQSDAGM